MAIIILFLIAVFSLLIVNIGSAAFRMTGLSRDVASFQAIRSELSPGGSRAALEASAGTEPR